MEARKRYSKHADNLKSDPVLSKIIKIGADSSCYTGYNARIYTEEPENVRVASICGDKKELEKFDVSAILTDLALLLKAIHKITRLDSTIFISFLPLSPNY